MSMCVLTFLLPSEGDNVYRSVLETFANYLKTELAYSECGT